jgi:hypothetical protein
MPGKSRAPLQPLIDDFAKQAGGELVTDLIDTRNPPSNADYFFREQNVIIELKALESDTFGDSYKTKLGQLVAAWVARGLIEIYGTNVPLRLNELPPECQDDWNALTRRSMQSKVFAKANAQISATKRLLGRAAAKGVLLLASDGNKDLQPGSVWFLAGQILDKKHPDGSPQYSHINGLAYFTPRIPVWVPQRRQHVFIWADDVRGDDAALSDFLKSLASAWHHFQTRQLGAPIPRLTAESFAPVRDASFPGAQAPSIDVNYWEYLPTEPDNSGL